VAKFQDLLAVSLMAMLASPPAHFAQLATSAQSEEGTTPPVSRIDPKAQEALDQAVRALGGEAFLNARTLRTAGRTFAISEGSTAGFAQFESIVEFPNKRRFTYGKDKPVTLINDGERGWQIDKYGMIRQPPEQVWRWKIAARYGYENLLRQIIREPGLLIQDAGRDFTDNLTARVVSITDSQQVRIKMYLHTVSSLPIRVTYRVRNPESREWDEFAEVYGDYKDFQGIQTPMHITRFLNGERYSEVFRKSAEYNVAAPASTFTPGG
jgi:hypothetical protein